MIDPVSNLVGKPIMIRGGELDDAQTPELQEIQKKMFDDLGATTSIEIMAGKPHTTSYDDPVKFWKWIWPRMTNSGKLSAESDVNVASYSDLSFLDAGEGYYIRFD